MVVVFQNISETKVSTAGGSFTISAPSGFSPGDLFIAVMTINGAPVITAPAGWTLITATPSGSSSRFNTYYRIAQSGDTNWTWTTSIGVQWIGWVLRYTGHDATNPIHASGDSVGSSSSPTPPSVAFTDLAVGSLTLQGFGADDDDTPYTTPAALTERFNDVSNTGYQTCGSAGGDKAVSGTGSTGTGVFTQNTSEQWAAATIIIEASIAGGAVAPTSIFIGPFGGPFGGPIQ